MNAAAMIRSCRLRGGWSLRALGERADTSHATLAAYESARVAPGIDTLGRVVNAAGFELEPSFVRVVFDHETRGQELLDVLDLAEQFPARHSPMLLYPPFGRA